MVLMIRHTSARGMVYERRGSGPVVLFVHGWCLNRQLWIYQEQALGAQSTTITVDLAGFGESAGLAGPYSVIRHAEDLAALLTELDVRPAVVVGFAYGAMVAIELARIAPDSVGDLMLIGVPSASTAPYGRMARSMIRDWPDFAARSIASICANELSQASRQWLVTMYGGTPLPAALEVLGELEVWEPLPIVESLSQRTIVVSGSQDTIVPISVRQMLPDRPCFTVSPSERHL